MKIWFITLSCLLISIPALCGTGQNDGSTTCYVFEQNKLLKMIEDYQYSAEMGGSQSYYFDNVEYTIPNMGTMFTVYSSFGNKLDNSGNLLNQKSEISLNNQPAVLRFRDADSLKILYKEGLENQSALSCFVSITSGWEICTVRSMP